MLLLVGSLLLPRPPGERGARSPEQSTPHPGRQLPRGPSPAEGELLEQMRKPVTLMA